MTHGFFVATVAAIALATAGCEQNAAAPADGGGNSAAPGDAQGAVEAAKQTEAAMLAAFEAKDAAKLASYYSDDALLALPGRTVHGSEAVRKALADDFGDPGFTLSFTNERADAAASGDLAWTSGSFRASWTNPQTRQVENGEGTYITVFRKQPDGSWKAVADVATPKGPAPQ